MRTERQLIRRFVDAMERLDDSVFTHKNPPPEELVAGIDTENDWNRILWKPRAIDTPRDALDVIHAHIQPLPYLFEELVLSYRWVSVYLVVCRLFANPPGHDLAGLADEMFKDPVMNASLLPAGFARFALDPEDYDPICFDVNRFAKGDCPIVKFDHESILMHDQLAEMEQLYDSFREMIVTIVTIDH